MKLPRVSQLLEMTTQELALRRPMTIQTTMRLWIRTNQKQGKGHTVTPPPNPSPKPDSKVKRSRVRIRDPEELAGVWQEFLSAKFTPTELKNTTVCTRSTLEQLRDSEDKNEAITREEFDDVVDSMKKAKAPAPGSDGIPAEVWQNSNVATDMPRGCSSPSAAPTSKQEAIPYHSRGHVSERESEWERVSENAREWKQ